MKIHVPRRAWLVAACLPIAWVTVACADMFRSDSQNAGRQSAQARQAALASMRQASSQSAVGRPVTGPALVQLLSGKTHVQAYRKRAADPKPFLTRYDYYAPDGTFIGRDTHSRRTLGYQDLGRWKVSDESLCITQPSGTTCYTIRLAPDGAVQYWIHEPGDTFHGLFTRNITDMRAGLQEPEYISDPAAFR